MASRCYIYLINFIFFTVPVIAFYSPVPATAGDLFGRNLIKFTSSVLIAQNVPSVYSDTGQCVSGCSGVTYGSVSSGGNTYGVYLTGQQQTAAPSVAPAKLPSSGNNPYNGGGETFTPGGHPTQNSPTLPLPPNQPAGIGQARPAPGTSGGGSSKASAGHPSGGNGSSTPGGSTAKSDNVRSGQQSSDQQANGQPNNQSTTDGGAQQAQNAGSTAACLSAFQSAQLACQGPVGGGFSTASALGLGGAVGEVVANSQGSSSNSVTASCGNGAGLSVALAGTYAAYAAACEAARSSCLSSCATTTSDPTANNDRLQCQSFASYTAAGMTGALQYGSLYAQNQACVSAARANAALAACSGPNASANPQCATDCNVATNQSSPYCQSYFAANPCLAPGGTASPACICSKNPSDPVCNNQSIANTAVGINPAVGGAQNSNSGLLAQFAAQGGLNRNPVFTGNKGGKNLGGLSGPLTAPGQGGGLPQLGGGQGGGGLGSAQNRAGAPGGVGYNTNINKGFRSANAVLPVPLAGNGGGGYRGPAAVGAKPFTMMNLRSLMPQLAGQNGFRVVAPNAPKFQSGEITAANGPSNFQKVHMAYLRLLAEHQLMRH